MLRSGLRTAEVCKVARGIANGEPVVSQASTDEYRAGHDRVFGEPQRNPGRRRYVLDQATGRLVEVGSDWQEAPRRVPLVGDSYYDGLRSPVDGSDISTRRKYREYLKATGYTNASDYTETWQRAAEERASPVQKDPGRRDEIGRVVYELEKRQRHGK